MERVKQERFAVLLLKGLTIDEASELTSLIKEERLEWHKQEVKKLIIPNVVDMFCECEEPDFVKSKNGVYWCKNCGKYSVITA